MAAASWRPALSEALRSVGNLTSWRGNGNPKLLLFFYTMIKSALHRLTNLMPYIYVNINLNGSLNTPMSIYKIQNNVEPVMYWNRIGSGIVVYVYVHDRLSYRHRGFLFPRRHRSWLCPQALCMYIYCCRIYNTITWRAILSCVWLNNIFWRGVMCLCSTGRECPLNFALWWRKYANRH